MSSPQNKNITIEDYATAILSQLSKKLNTTEIPLAFDKTSKSLKTPPQHKLQLQFNLQPTFDEFAKQSPNDRQRFIERTLIPTLESLFSKTASPININLKESFQKLSSQIMPRIRTKAQVDAMNAQLKKTKVASYPFPNVPGLYITFCLDFGTYKQTLTAEHVEAWGEDKIQVVAMSNLLNRTQTFKWKKLKLKSGELVYVSAWLDYFDHARALMLNDKVFSPLKVEGDMLVFPAADNVVIVTGSTWKEALEYVQQDLLKSVEKQRDYITSTPLKWKDGKFTEIK